MTTSRPPGGQTDRIVAGIGCASAATPDEIVQLIEACLAEAGLKTEQLVAIGTHERKRGSGVLAAVAARYAVPLRFLGDLELEGPGVCEAVAGAAGPLLVSKRKSAYATCAIARCAADFEMSRFGQAERSSAAMASSIVPTSWAGP